MNVRSIALGTLSLALFAAVAVAGPGKETKLSEFVSLYGGGAPSLSGTTNGVLGLGYQLNIPMGQNHHWTASPGFEYGYGHYKDEHTGTSPSTYESTTTSWGAMLDFLYFNDCCDDDDFYCGPGLFYSSTKFKDKQTGSADFTTDPFNTFGLQMTVGGGIPLGGPKLELTGSATQRLGMTSYDHKASGSEDKASGITYSTQFSGGLRVRF
jgi:hypothetical protein